MGLRLCGLLLAIGFLVLTIGCGAESEPESPAQVKTKKVIPGVNAPLTGTAKARPKREQPKPSLNLEIEPPSQQTVRPATAIHPEVNQLLERFKQSKDDAPTLVVWIVDRTKSAANMVDAVKMQAQYFYDGLVIEEEQQTETNSEEALTEQTQLLTSVYSFGESTERHLAASGDFKAVTAAFTQISIDSSGVENSFAAVRQATDDVLDFRRKQGYEVFLVVVTDEAGDDQDQAELLRSDLAKYVIPVYVVGVHAPFGKRAILPEHVEAGVDGAAGRMFINQGPETRDTEQLLMEYPTASMVTETVDSGFGPFAWEYICRISGGSFLALRAPGYTSSMLNRPGSRPVALIGSYKRSSLQKYAPDYISQAEYEAKIQENKALAALIQVSKLETIPVLNNPKRDFVKRDEAGFSRDLSQSQLTAAQLEPALLQAYEILRLGESDRSKLTNLRWQAGYDLAMGRLLAARSRVEGYNAMLALMKRGKTFENETSTTWVLVPSMDTEVGSVIKKIGERAVQYLERVKTEHSGTPWARMAEMELQVPVHWQWQEQ
ncbi:MAG: hypothetical protein HOH50_03940 [Planctomycetaceae bacterium]|nr:hypothetical protein [Planctomycetaceae bacterium]MBT5883360.1 hypothetical protein [Planctomycetaceae bacterium]MBT7255218.1 hypothetical protein [Planctomycetaceae bacterium]